MITITPSQRTCPICGAAFSRKPSQRGNFCSRACKNIGISHPHKPIEDRFWSKVNKTATCWLWTASVNPMGYGQFGINGHCWLAHRFSYTLAYGPILPGFAVCHRCDTPACVRPDHLFVATRADNIADAVAKGRIAHGDSHYQTKRKKARLASQKAISPSAGESSGKPSS